MTMMNISSLHMIDSLDWYSHKYCVTKVRMGMNWRLHCRNTYDNNYNAISMPVSHENTPPPPPPPPISYVINIIRTIFFYRHYNDVTWAPMRLKSPATDCLFDSLFTKVKSKQQILPEIQDLWCISEFSGFMQPSVRHPFQSRLGKKLQDLYKVAKKTWWIELDKPDNLAQGTSYYIILE